MRLLATPNALSIGVPKLFPGMLFGMATLTLAERLLRVRKAAGYGEDRRAAEFARLIGIKPPSLHDLESGETKSLGGKSLQGYVRIGANPEFIRTGRGPAMLFKDIERKLRLETLMSMFDELDANQQQTVEEVVKGFLRAKPGSSENDPFKFDPPKS
jgi:transcriptional regulator with XRE-family HTH domain